METTTPVDLEQLVGGRWVQGSGERVVSDNPARPSVTVAAGAGAVPSDLSSAVSSARGAASQWAATPAHERGDIPQRASTIVGAAAAEWGTELALEEGKTPAEGIGEVRRAAQILAYFGSAADAESGELSNSPRRGERIIVTRRPLCTVGLITPFNFPIAIPASKLAPAIAYGNTVLWKPAGTVPLLAMRLAQALVAAGLPEGVLNLLIGDGVIGAAIVDHPRIDAISFTGSTRVGRSIGSAGALRGIAVQAELVSCA